MRRIHLDPTVRFHSSVLFNFLHKLLILKSSYLYVQLNDITYSWLSMKNYINLRVILIIKT